MKKFLILTVIGIAISLAVKSIRTELSSTLTSTESSEEPSPTAKPYAFKCSAREKVQLMDSEKCEWACSTYITAPTEARCQACGGIIISGACPQCPPLCKPSMWVMERGTKPPEAIMVKEK